VGDIHGCLGPLRALHQLIRDDAADHPASRKLVIYLGDYIDRGMDSRGVVDLLLQQPLTGFEPVYLKGNHEDALLRFLEGEAIGPEWISYGGDATLLSYGVRPPGLGADARESQRARRELAKKLPTEHIDFLRRLALVHTEGDYLFVHAGLRPGIALDRQSAADMLWIRDEFLRTQADFGKMVVHGHSITEAPEMRHNRIGIDTGAFASGHLTCLVLDGASRFFLTT
jgi:serine/threonine protein phosphatase 1